MPQLGHTCARFLMFPIDACQTVQMDAETASSAAQELVGSKIIDRRIELGMNQADLARSAGVDPRTVRELERGQRWPRDSNRAQIETALGWGQGSLERMLDGLGPLSEPHTNTTEGTPLGAMSAGQSETAAQLVLTMDEIFGRLHSTLLSPAARKALPEAETRGLLENLDQAAQLAETLAVSIAGSGEALAVLKRAERARIRAVTWAPPSAEHEAELAARTKTSGAE